MGDISIDQYFGKWHPAAMIHLQNAGRLLASVQPVIDAARANGVMFKINPATATLISGTQYGGYRPLSCPEGAPSSAHKTGEAVDVYDPDNALDNWLDDVKLERFGLYREHPDSTIHWCHLTTRAPGSKKRTFYP